MSFSEKFQLFRLLRLWLFQYCDSLWAKLLWTLNATEEAVSGASQRLSKLFLHLDLLIVAFVTLHSVSNLTVLSLLYIEAWNHEVAVISVIRFISAAHQQSLYLFHAREPCTAMCNGELIQPT